jgi:hypothetical protein
MYYLYFGDTFQAIEFFEKALSLNIKDIYFLKGFIEKIKKINLKNF